MWYVEELLHEMESSLNSLNKNKAVYKHVEIDLTKKQILLITEQIEMLLEILEKIQKTFNLENEATNASKIIQINTYDILNTINETWSSYMEKTSGKIDSVEEKKQIDGYLNQILQHTNRIKEIRKKK